MREKNQMSILLQQYMHSLEMQEITDRFLWKEKYVIDHVWTKL
jgi:hypothetical protein